LAAAMRFSDDLLEEIRTRLPVSEVVKRRVALKKQGREWRGLSPFNKEKTPSFFVNDQKGFFHDFSSGKHGDIFGFVMETEGLSFPEAVENLASLAGIPLPTATREAQAREQRHRTLYDVLELAAKFFENTLASAQGAKARGYLAKREIEPKTQVEFRLGYALSDRFALKQHLGKHGIPVADMIEAGLVIAGDDIPVPYDRFRDRLIIPIQDQRGRVIAFGGRALNEEAEAKYLNSPETPLFRKGETIFNFHRARVAAREESLVIAVEGYLDAISVYQAGMKFVVAVMGTAVTEEQIQSLWRLAPEPIMCLDGDKAGVAAAGRSLERILPVLRTGVSSRFAFLPIGQDPDDVIRKGGAEKFKSVLGAAIPLWDMLWERELEKRVIQTPDHKAMFERDIFELIEHIGDKRVRENYRFRARAQLVALFKSLDWQAAIAKNPKKKRNASSSRQPSFVRDELRPASGELRLTSENPLEKVEKTLLGLLIEYPTLLELHVETLMATELSGKLELFKREIYRIFEEFRGYLSVLTFYEEIQDDYCSILEDVHGKFDKQRNEPIATSLYRRFPLLKWDPPVEFIDTVVRFFFDRLHVAQVERELRELRSHPDRMNDDGELERVTNLARYFLEERGRLIQRDMELAERATDIRRQIGAPFSWPPTGLSLDVPAITH
jgi:DNA primase